MKLSSPTLFGLGATLLGGSGLALLVKHYPLQETVTQWVADCVEGVKAATTPTWAKTLGQKQKRWQQTLARFTPKSVSTAPYQTLLALLQCLSQHPQPVTLVQHQADGQVVTLGAGYLHLLTLQQGEVVLFEAEQTPQQPYVFHLTDIITLQVDYHKRQATLTLHIQEVS